MNREKNWKAGEIWQKQTDKRESRKREKAFERRRERVREREKGASQKKAEENGIEMAAAADNVLHYVKPNQTEPRLLLFGFSHRTVDLYSRCWKAGLELGSFHREAAEMTTTL